MSKGLKQLVAEATETEAAAPKPVTVSPKALQALSAQIRMWSGWRDAAVHITDPANPETATAQTDHGSHRFILNAERLVLNPNRVLLSVTPFRLRQEAVLTGALLHEAGHARFTHWVPRTPEARAAFTHSDGSPVSDAALALARLIEEPRIEGLMARDAKKVGATGLDWTMRASAAYILPMTPAAADPDQQIMDLIGSYILRAGRQMALLFHTHRHGPRRWVNQFSDLLVGALQNRAQETGAIDQSNEVLSLIHEGLLWDGDEGPTLVDIAKKILGILFPETDAEDMPQPQVVVPCASGGDSDEEESGESDESGESGEEESDESDESGDSGESGESDESDEGEGEGGAVSDGSDTDETLAKRLAQMENLVKEETTEETTEEKTVSLGGMTGGEGSGYNNGSEHWRAPDKSERGIQVEAGRFLRDLIEPSEASKVSLTDSPSATVDGAALSAWKAGGQVNAPHFFRRTQRSVEPSPPVKIAILVDVSGSMEVLAKPSAILSWALASAALDLRNFAGRGQQVESCMIQWGDNVRVVQPNGQTLPGIHQPGMYMQGTSAMHLALDEVENQMPGFFTPTEQPENRLLVQFTDWELSWGGTTAAESRVHKALAAGVNMLSVVPSNYSERYAVLDRIIASAPLRRGATPVLRYNPQAPGQVWENAAKALS